MIDYTTVLGVDARHVEQLQMVLPTWKNHKPSLFSYPMLVFYDREQLIACDVFEAIEPYSKRSLEVVPWPPSGVKYEGDPKNKWTNPQREKMLSGFIHIPAKFDYVKTKYWLKIDTDVVATGNDDWIEETWFEDEPAIISQKWSYTKPGDQMMLLDKWVEDNPEKLSYWNEKPPLNLIPNPGSSLVSHKRIISWVSFFNTEFTKLCSKACEETCGIGKMPCPSQDGTVFYLAKRGDFGIIRTNMKGRGWSQKSSMGRIRSEVEKAMK